MPGADSHLSGGIYCRNCCYDLRAQTAPYRCPECGQSFDPADRKTILTRPRRGAVWHWPMRVVLLLLLSLGSMAMMIPLGALDPLPYLFLATVLDLMFIAGWSARAAGKRHVEGWVALGVGLVYSVVFWGIILKFTNVPRKITVPAGWHFEQRGNGRIVVVDTGNGYGGFEVKSRQLEQYLENTKPAQVQVMFTGYYDFGSLRATGVAEQVDGIPVMTLYPH